MRNIYVRNVRIIGSTLRSRKPEVKAQPEIPEPTYSSQEPAYESEPAPEKTAEE